MNTPRDNSLHVLVVDDSAVVREVMNATPRTIGAAALVATAVRVMEDNQPGAITSLVVVDEARRIEGVIHLHDCLRLGVR